MEVRTVAPLAVAFLLAAPLTSHAALSAYSQDFESLAPRSRVRGTTTR